MINYILSFNNRVLRSAMDLNFLQHQNKLKQVMLPTLFVTIIINEQYSFQMTYKLHGFSLHLTYIKRFFRSFNVCEAAF